MDNGELTMDNLGTGGTSGVPSPTGAGAVARVRQKTAKFFLRWSIRQSPLKCSYRRISVPPLHKGGLGRRVPPRGVGTD